MAQKHQHFSQNNSVYLIGSGIASLASAFYLIKDIGICGSDIYIIEQDKILGGSLDGAGNAETGFIIRGGRMHEEHFVCYWDLLSHIPAYEDPAISVKDETFEFNARFVSNAQARLLKKGNIINSQSFGLSRKHRLYLARLSLKSEKSLDNLRIEDWFSHDFFCTNFWYFWATTFAFQRWSSLAHMRRYMRRFIHLVDGLPTLKGIMRTKYNQYHSVVLPLKQYLEKQGVQFKLQTQVVDIDFVSAAEKTTATAIYTVDNNSLKNQISLRPNDFVFITNGSITDSTDQGSWTTAPHLKNKSTSGAWTLWETLANKDKAFGKPSVFSDRIDQQKWYSFTATLADGTFHNYMQQFSGNIDGTGGLVTLTDSSWLMSIVIARQPHFPNQPEGVNVFWGYGLYPDKPGDYVKKKMSECSGQEILQELWHQLTIESLMSPVMDAGKINCIPVAMPFINSLFMPCAAGDRPDVVPKGASNFAFLGQFAEVPKDCVFTVEYSVRTAQTAVYSLFDTNKHVLPVYDSVHKPNLLLKAIRALHR